MFIGQAGFFQLANGQDGQMGDAPDLTAIVKNSGNYQSLLNYFNSNVASAKDLSTFLSLDPVNGSAGFDQEVQDYMSVLDPSDTKTGGSSLLDNIDNSLFGNLTFDQLNAAIGDGNGNIDDTKLDNLILQLEQQDPNISGSPQDTKTTAGQAFTIVKDVWAAMRLGSQFGAAYNELFDGKISLDKLKTLGKNGVLHGVNSVFGAIAVVLGAAGKPPSDPAQIANLVGQAMGPVGQMLNTGGRVYNYFSLTGAQDNLKQAQDGLAAATTKLDDANRSKVTADRDLVDAKK
jgi:hypothetical protein